MPRSSTVSYERFFRKAEALQELHGRVTYERIRDALGSGSMTTLKPLMERWQQERSNKTALGAPRALRNQIDVVVRDLFRQVSELAEEEKNQALAESQAQLEKERLRADRADNHAMACNEELTSLKVALKERDGRIVELMEKLDEAHQSRRQLEQQEETTHLTGQVSDEALLEKLTGRTTALNEARDRLQEEQRRSEKLRMELEELRASNSGVLSAMQSQYEEISRNMATLITRTRGSAEN